MKGLEIDNNTFDKVFEEADLSSKPQSAVTPVHYQYSRSDLVIVCAPKYGVRGSKSVDEAYNRRYRIAFENKLRSLGLDIEECSSVTTKQKLIFLRIFPTWEFLSKTAEMLGIRAAVAPNDLPESKALATRIWHNVAHCFRKNAPTDPPPFEITDDLKIQFKLSFMEYYLKNDDLANFFSSSQRSLMTEYVISQTTLYSSINDERNKTSPVDENDKTRTLISFQWLVNRGVYSHIYTEHARKTEKSSLYFWLMRNWVSLKNLFWKQPLDYVCRYLGSEIAFYYAWLEFYTLMLIIPAVFSIPCLGFGVYSAFYGPMSDLVCNSKADNITLCRKCPQVSCQYRQLSGSCMQTRFTSLFDNVTTVPYSIMMSVWAVTFLELWKRQQHRLSEKWKSMGKATKEEVIRPDFLNTVKNVRINPVTRQQEKFVKKRENVKRKCIATMVALALILIVLANMAGLIMYKMVAAGVYKKLNNRFINEVTPKLLTSITASVINLMFMTVMSNIYPKIAYKMTEYELHKTQSDFDRSYTYKVVLFEFFNYYGTLFYLAFVHGKVSKPPQHLSVWDKRCGPAGCMSAISVQLMIICTGKQIFQMFIEMSLPISKKFFRKLTFKKAKGEQFEVDIGRWERDYLLLEMPSPTLFGDYLEMVLQYGFIVMFAPAFPLGALFALLNNILEIRLDAYKYMTNYRRPVPREALSIGPWINVLELFTKFGIIVNSATIAFTTYIPSIQYYQHKYTNPGQKNVSLFDFMFSIFRTTDYTETNHTITIASANYSISADELRYSGNHGKIIEYCYYQGSYYPPDGDNLQYTHTSDFFKIVIIRIAYLVILENFCILIQALITYYLPPYSEEIKNRALREQYLEKELFLKSELGRNDGTTQQEQEEQLDEEIAESEIEAVEAGGESDSETLSDVVEEGIKRSEPQNMQITTSCLPRLGILFKFLSVRRIYHWFKN